MANDLVKIKYIGRSPEVEVNPDGLGWVEVMNGETIAVPASLAYEMLRQVSNWTVADEKSEVEVAVAASKPAPNQKAAN